MRTCVICEVSIEGRHFNAITCSTACANKRKLEVTNDWKRTHADEYRALQRGWYAKNRSRVLERSKERIANNPSQRLKVQAAYRLRHQEKLREQGRIKATKARAALKLIREIQSKGMEALL